MTFDPSAALQEILDAHELATERVPSGIAVSHSDFIASAGVVRVTNRPQATNVQLDVRVISNRLEGRLLIESFSGVGPAEEEATRNAFKKFLRASFHTLLATFIDPKLGSDQVEWETWESGDRNWRVCLGPLIPQVYKELPVDLGQLTARYSKLLDRVRADLLPGLSPGTHWFRFYIMRKDGKTFASEALLDNSDWTQMREVVAAWDWPTGDFSARQFFTLSA